MRALTAVVALAVHATQTLAQVDPTEHQAFADNLSAVLYANANKCSSALGVSMAFLLV
jgi:hypothetical protein